jgi:hypothetical protein
MSALTAVGNVAHCKFKTETVATLSAVEPLSCGTCGAIAMCFQQGHTAHAKLQGRPACVRTPARDRRRMAVTAGPCTRPSPRPCQDIARQFHASQCLRHPPSGRLGESKMALAIKAVAQTIGGSRDIVDKPSGTSDFAQPRSSV